MSDAANAGQVCTRCARVLEARVAQLEAQLNNALTSLDAMTERSDDAEWLCQVLAWHLEERVPEFVDTVLTDEEREWWDIVQPFGAEDE